MDLLPLPNFYHKEMTVLLLIIFIIAGIFFLKRKRRKSVKIDFSDPYTLTQILYTLSDCPQKNEFLQELQHYKYRPNPPKLPKELIEKIKRCYNKEKRKKS